MTAKQGHIYMHRDKEVMALGSGEFVTVAELTRDELWPLGVKSIAHAQDLEPLPMRYFGGGIP